MSESDAHPSTTSADATPGLRPRIDTIDYAKGLGICLVVAGHAWRGLDSRVSLPAFFKTDGPIDRGVYGFHMPLFFVVSGLFLYRSAGKPAREYIADKTSTLLWPFVVWTAIYLVADKFVGAGKAFDMGTFGRSLVNPISHLWFLWILLWIATVMLVLRKLRLPSVAVFMISVGAYLATARYGLHLRLSRATSASLERPLFQFAMFFPYVAGAALLARPLLAACARVPLTLWIVTCVAGAAIVTYATRSGNADAQMFNFVSGVAGTLMVLGLARILEHDCITIFRLLGVYSLEIYLAHILAIAGTRLVLLKAVHVSAWWVHLPLGIAGGLALPLAFAVMCKSSGMPLLFRLPRRRPAKRGDVAH